MNCRIQFGSLAGFLLIEKIKQVHKKDQLPINHIGCSYCELLKFHEGHTIIQVFLPVVF
jgi:hypothetical protein